VALIFLSGLSGSGKTEIGKRLAQRLGQPFVETDAEIQHLSGKKIVQIFAEDGEEKFRALESAVINISSHLPEGVIALGGGALQPKDNFKTVTSSGTLVYLQADSETLANRIFPERSRRPLLANCESHEELKQTLEGMLAQREKQFRTAKFTINTAAFPSIESIVDQLCKTLNLP
jgi:shikimate kinase